MLFRHGERGTNRQHTAFVVKSFGIRLIDEIIFLLFVRTNPSYFINRMWDNISSGRTGAVPFSIGHLRAQPIPHTHAISAIPLYANTAIAIII